MQRQNRNLAVVCLVVACAAFGLGAALSRFTAHGRAGRPLWFASLTGERGARPAPGQTLAVVLDSLEDSYVDRITDEKPLTYGALRQMMDELDDPNSRFLDPAETRDVLDAEDGTFHGIGAVVNVEATHLKDGERRRLIVADVLPNSPAERAGLGMGDQIVKIGDKWVYASYENLPPAHVPNAAKANDPKTPGKDRVPQKVAAPEAGSASEEDALLFSTHDILQKLSRDGQDVTLTLLSRDGKSLEEKTFHTASTRVVAVLPSKDAAGVGQIHVEAFTKSVGPELDAALADLKKQGVTHLALDLRGCVGGPLDRAAQIAGRFVEGGIGSVERKTNGHLVRQPVSAHRAQAAWNGPLVVLVDKGTLGTAEFLAAALAQHGHAQLVGTRTFGDGLEHSVIPLKDGSSLLMTTGRFFTESGQAYEAKGILPGVAVAEAARQNGAAVKLLQGMKG